MIWKALYSQLTAIQALSVGSHDEPRLNERGIRILRYLQSRRGRK